MDPTSLSQCADEDDEILEPSLSELVTSDSLKWIFVGGKGGVGKTTVSCSIAISLAKRRKKVLVLSTDPAHNVSDAFGQKFSGVPQQVEGFDNLFAMETDPEKPHSMHSDLGSSNAGSGGSLFELGEMIPEFMSAIPGIDEALGFGELIQAVQSLDYSVIVFDTAPTGHTLRLLSFPDILQKALKKISRWRDNIASVLKILSTISSQAVDPEEIQNRFDSLKALTSSVRETFQDPTKTTFICVCIPEFLSLYETERLVQELTLQNIDCSNIVVNQIVFPLEYGSNFSAKTLKSEISPTSDDSVEMASVRHLLDLSLKKLDVLEQYYHSRRCMQSKYLSQIQDLYSYEFHVVSMPLKPEEIRGVQKLVSFGEELLILRHLPIISSSEQNPTVPRQQRITDPL